jgi:hypothetical protein
MIDSVSTCCDGGAGFLNLIYITLVLKVLMLRKQRVILPLSLIIVEDGSKFPFLGKVEEKLIEMTQKGL